MIVLRHCQSEFNLHFTRTRRDPGIIDAPLTEAGLHRAAELAGELSGETISRIIVSPYRRALQTVAPTAARLGLPVTVTSLVGERGAFACDIGSPRSDLERDWPMHDFSSLDEAWWPASGESEASVEARAAQFRAEMAALPDWREALVVSHWGFLLALTGESLENGTWTRVDPTMPLGGPVSWHY